MRLVGGHLAYTRAGTSPSTLLLIHRLGGNRQTWRHLIPSLAREHTVIAPDLPGHGESDPPARDYSLGAYACAMRDLLLALGLGQVTLIGHSLGGGVALEIAYQFPDRAGRLVLISSGGLGPQIGPMLRVATLAAPDAAASAGPLRGLAGARQRRAFVRTAHAVIDWSGQTVCASRQLGLLRDVPVLVAWGARDTTISPNHQQSFGERVPHASLVEIPDGGHFPHETASEQVLAAIDSFLTTSAPLEYSEAKWVELLTATRMQSLAKGIADRETFDVAVGVLMHLRLCTRQEAVDEMTIAGRDSEVGSVRMARALVAILGESSHGAEIADCVAALDRWAHLLDARAWTGSSSPVGSSSVRDDIAIRYGGVNASTRC